MAHESFEDEALAKELNERFVSIKVDREERPDVDSIYMKVCQALTGQGGWPLNVFLTPEQKPFYAGTYFPRESRFNIPGFVDVITQLYDQYKDNHEKVIGIGDKITRAFQEKQQSSGALSKDVLHECFNQLEQSFDEEYGGFGDAPKFPAPHMLTYLLRYGRWANNENALTMVTKTLNAMADGGLYDHIGFGFARYSVDEKWLVPHFEKMLYDNAMLAIAYTEAYQVTKNKRFQAVAREILSYVDRDMRDADGGFYSAEDADSEGVEGKFYLWDKEEVIDILGEERGEAFCERYGISKEGNFEGKNIPNLIKVDQENVLSEGMEKARQQLFKVRERRIHPHKDDKILTSWNGLMIAAFAKAGRVFGDGEYVKIAKDALTFVENRLAENKRLMSRFRDGEVKNKGFIDDYANMLWACIEMYETTLEVGYIEKADNLAKEMIDLFWDEADGGFYFYGNDAEELIYRPKELYDGALPSGNSVAALSLFRLARLTGKTEYEEKTARMFSIFADDVGRYPSGFCYFLQSFLTTEMESKEVVVLGEKTNEKFQRLVDVLHKSFLPEVAYLAAEQPERLSEIASFTKDFTGKENDVFVYVCENFSCRRPTSDIDEVLSQLQEDGT